MSDLKPGRGRIFLVNMAVMFVVTLVVLLAAEPLLRLRYVEPVPPQPPAVAEVQPYLTLHPNLGYTWIPNVSADRNIIFHNNDIEYGALSTDEFGVVNVPDAITRRAEGEPVRVLGLGDSFMEMAAPGFHRAFGDRGTFYYSLAIHRHAPPHYAAMFRLHGLALKPSVVLVGLFENDFAETEDFENWRESRLDWFAYHSGTWCGRPVPISAERRFIRRWFRGYEGLTNVLRIRLRAERMSVAGPSDHQVERVTAYLSEIAETSRENSAAMWLILIPSKPTARGEVTPEAKAYDRVAAALAPKVAGIIDLRPVFQQHPDPASLYYRIDGHWNRAGVALAAQTVLARLNPGLTALDSHEPGNH
jgi:hypothetical protein